MVREQTLSVGSRVLPGTAGVRFRIWAPGRTKAQLLLESGPGSPAEVELEPADGYFNVIVPDAGRGTRYRFRLDGAGPFPDPASRFQPDGPHGASEVIDPDVFAWTDREWKGVQLAGQIVYEMHVGTFTDEGTWTAAQRQLPIL